MSLFLARLLVVVAVIGVALVIAFVLMLLLPFPPLLGEL